MEQTLEEFIFQQAKYYMGVLSNEQRLEIINKYCVGCGSNNTNCQCEINSVDNNTRESEHTITTEIKDYE